MKRHGMEQVKGNHKKEGSVQSTLNVLLGSGNTKREKSTSRDRCPTNNTW